jgi:hypothetical protein
MKNKPIMKASFFFLLLFLLAALCILTVPALAQRVKDSEIPAAVKSALTAKYPAATKVSWEKEKGNFEANWGGKSGEDNSVVFTPGGSFVEQVVAIPVSGLPPGVATYVKAHYPGAKITEAGKVTDAGGKTLYEAEVKKKDLLFDEKGAFVKID